MAVVVAVINNLMYHIFITDKSVKSKKSDG